MAIGAAGNVVEGKGRENGTMAGLFAFCHCPVLDVATKNVGAGICERGPPEMSPEKGVP